MQMPKMLDNVSKTVKDDLTVSIKKSDRLSIVLYTFQKDAVLAIINKLESYNGCILADSVGLGKTFTALAVVKHYENRNRSVLVLCPKKLSDNWNTYKDNYVNNPIAADRLRYDVLYHTDLSRDRGKSNGLDLERLNWGNYDLVVIDESHNFRNGGEVYGDDRRENRYLRLMNRVIRTGVKTKVLMLSATPVNNRFTDLRHQLELAYEGNPSLINEKLGTKRTIDEIFRNAQKTFNQWSKKDESERTTNALLKSLDFDFFEVPDSVTIAHSCKHIEKYYNAEEKGDLEYRKAQLKRLQEEVVDIEDMQSGISIMDLGLNEFRLDLLEYVKNNGDMDKIPFGLHAVVPATEDCPPGIVFVLKNRNNSVNIDKRILPTIAKAIPYKILFILVFGSEAQAWIEAAGTFYNTDWQPLNGFTLKFEGLNLDAVYESLARQISGGRLGTDGDIEEAVDRDKQRQKLERDIAA